MWTVSSDVSIKRRHRQPLSVHLLAYCTNPTLGTRGFSRVQREFSVLAEGRHMRVTIKTWQKPETALEKSLAPRVYQPNPWCEWCDVWRLAIPPGSTSPTLFEKWCGLFYVPQEPDKCKCCLTRPTVFSSLSEKTRKSNRYFAGITKQHFLVSYLKTLSVGQAGVRTRDLPLSRPALSQLSQPGGGAK